MMRSAAQASKVKFRPVVNPGLGPALFHAVSAVYDVPDESRWRRNIFLSLGVIVVIAVVGGVTQDVPGWFWLFPGVVVLMAVYVAITVWVNRPEKFHRGEVQHWYRDMVHGRAGRADVITADDLTPASRQLVARAASAVTVLGELRWNDLHEGAWQPVIDVLLEDSDELFLPWQLWTAAAELAADPENPGEGSAAARVAALEAYAVAAREADLLLEEHLRQRPTEGVRWLPVRGGTWVQQPRSGEGLREVLAVDTNPAFRSALAAADHAQQNIPPLPTPSLTHPRSRAFTGDPDAIP